MADMKENGCPEIEYSSGKVPIETDPAGAESACLTGLNSEERLTEPGRYRCYNIEATGEDGIGEFFVDITSDDIDAAHDPFDTYEILHEAVFESGEFEGHIESFEYEPLP